MEIKQKKPSELWLKLAHKVGENPNIAFSCVHCFETSTRTETTCFIKHAPLKIRISQGDVRLVKPLIGAPRREI